MKTIENRLYLKYWGNWVFFSFLIIPLSYIASLIIVLLVHGAFGFGQMEGGTYLSQTVMQVAGGAVLGLGTGIYQRIILRKFFDVPLSWVYYAMTGFALAELIICIILWQMQINRYELRFIESNPLPEALFFASAGLLIGLLQWTILRKSFKPGIWWIPASTIGWGVSVITTIMGALAFFIGALFYGAITGTVIFLVIKSKDNIGVRDREINKG